MQFFLLGLLLFMAGQRLFPGPKPVLGPPNAERLAAMAENYARFAQGSVSPELLSRFVETELRDELGRSGKDVINSFGRWADEDIGFIYQRVTVAEQLEAMSSALANPGPVRPEMEAVYSGWSQPAYRR